MLRRALVALLVAPLVLACASGTVFKRNPKVSHDPKQAHAEADKNDDGYVDVEEFHHRMTEVYFHGDKDKDGYMTYSEMDETSVFHEDWTPVDTNGDGKVSLHELMRHRMDDFQDIDTNQDGLLSPGEVEAAFEAQGS